MTMMNQDFEIFSGEDKNIIFSIMNTKTNVLIPVEEISSIRWIITTSMDKAGILEKTFDDGITPSEEEVGNFVIKLNSIDTINLNGRYIHFAEIKDIHGNSTIAFIGSLKVRRIKI